MDRARSPLRQLATALSGYYLALDLFTSPPRGFNGAWLEIAVSLDVLDQLCDPFGPVEARVLSVRERVR